MYVKFKYKVIITIAILCKLLKFNVVYKNVIGPKMCLQQFFVLPVTVIIFNLVGSGEPFLFAAYLVIISVK